VDFAESEEHALLRASVAKVAGEFGHAYFQDLTALAPLLSHATARSQQASTSFESQARRPAGGYRATPARTSQRYDQAPQPGQAATSSPSLK